MAPRPEKPEIPYTILTQREILVAGNLLNDGTASFILYCYFALNADDYSFALSPAWIGDKLGISEKQYSKARDRLVATGYLVPRQGERDSYSFLRVPAQYAVIPIDDIEIPSHQERWHQKRVRKEKQQESCDGYPCLGEAEVCGNELPAQEQNDVHCEEICLAEPESDHQSPPKSVDQSVHEKGELFPFDGGRNIITSINNSTNSITGNQQGKHVESMKKEISEWEEKIRKEFGDLEECEDALLEAEWRARAKRYSEKTHISLLEKCYNRLKMRVETESRYQRSMYEQACEATIPKDMIARMKVLIILNKLVAEGRIPSRYGAWIQGWDEEQQTVKLTAYSEDLPLEVVRSQRHVLDGIPDWYRKKQKAG